MAFQKKNKSCENRWIYSRKATISHPAVYDSKFHECLTGFSALVRKEGGKPGRFLSEIIINVDCIETITAQSEKRSPGKTVDAAFVVSHIRRSDNRTVLIEFKLRVRNTENLRKKAIEDKVNHSRALLGSKPPIHPHYFLIFNEKVKQQAINRISWLFNKPIQKLPYKATTLKELYGKFFSFQ